MKILILIILLFLYETKDFNFFNVLYFLMVYEINITIDYGNSKL